MSTATLSAPPTDAAENPKDLVLEPKPDLFGPGWDVCPWCSAGTPHDGRRPCSCGGTVFLIVRNPGAAERCRHVCKTCYREPFRRLARSGDRVIGTYDATSGAFEPL